MDLHMSPRSVSSPVRLFLYQHHAVFITTSLSCNLGSGLEVLSAGFRFLVCSLKLVVSFMFPYEFWDCFSITGKYCNGILMGIELNVYIAFESVVIFTASHGPIHEFGNMSIFCFFFYTVSFFSSLTIWLYKFSFPSLDLFHDIIFVYCEWHFSTGLFLSGPFTYEGCYLC